jgi:A/G-specific adenine glycosylase
LREPGIAPVVTPKGWEGSLGAGFFNISFGFVALALLLMASSLKIDQTKTDHLVSTNASASSKRAGNQMKPHAVNAFHKRLKNWYQSHGRHDLPWRKTADPYHIWLSEIMLQQTQVQTVLDRYYQPFLNRFPNIETLANAPQEAVLKAWEGLGYYSRARNFHKAAKMLLAQGGFPPASPPPSLRGSPTAMHDLKAFLLALPGIGPNTAHAILAFAFHQPYAVMEANVKRIITRIYALEKPDNKQLFTLADALLNRAQPFHYNQAMMDLGAMVCAVKAPQCSVCPAQKICRGKAAPEQFPLRVKKKAVPTRKIVVLVQANADAKRLALQARDSRLLGGLYGFAQLPENTSPPKASQYLGQVRHAYTHFKLVAEIYLMRAKKGHNQLYTAAEIEALPLSTLDHKILALIKTQA